MARIMLIEDSPDLIEMLTMLFSIHGHNTAASLTPENVPAQIASFIPDIILVDAKLGKQSGRSLCKEIKKEHKALPVILMSADPTLLVNYEECEADDIIEKPFDIDEMIEGVNRLTSYNYPPRKNSYIVPFKFN